MVIASPCSQRQEPLEHLPPALIRQYLSRQVFSFYANTPSCSQYINSELQLFSAHIKLSPGIKYSVALDYIPVWRSLLSKTKQEIKIYIVDRQLLGFPDLQNFTKVKEKLTEGLSLLLLFRPIQTNTFTWGESWHLTVCTSTGKWTTTY